MYINILLDTVLANPVMTKKKPNKGGKKLPTDIMDLLIYMWWTIDTGGRRRDLFLAASVGCLDNQSQ